MANVWKLIDDTCAYVFFNHSIISFRFRNMFLWVCLAHSELKFIGNLFHQRSKLVVTVDCCNFESSGVVNTEYLSQSILIHISCLNLDPLRCPVYNVFEFFCEKYMFIHFIPSMQRVTSRWALISSLARNLDVVAHSQLATACDKLSCF